MGRHFVIKLGSFRNLCEIEKVVSLWRKMLALTLVLSCFISQA